jgi:hypothetical protein
MAVLSTYRDVPIKYDVRLAVDAAKAYHVWFATFADAQIYVGVELNDEGVAPEVTDASVRALQAAIDEKLGARFDGAVAYSHYPRIVT